MSSHGRKNPYEVLRAPANSSLSTLKAAWRREARRWHPDKNSSPAAQKQMAAINEAWRILSCPQLKAELDREIDAQDAARRQRAQQRAQQQEQQAARRQQRRSYRRVQRSSEGNVSIRQEVYTVNGTRGSSFVQVVSVNSSATISVSGQGSVSIRVETSRRKEPSNEES